MKVLLIDEHETDLFITRTYLKRLAQVNVIECLSFEEALGWMKNNLVYMPDLVVSEILVNNEECWAFLSQIPKESTFNTRFYILTTCILPQIKQKAMQNKMITEIYHKPMSHVMAKKMLRM